MLGKLAVARPVVALPRQSFTQRSSSIGVRTRATLSKIWVPTGGVSATDGESGHGKLIRAGFLRQAQSGIFHLLPLGLRVQSKIEALLDKHMESIGASRVALSSISSEDLWRRSGRLDRVSSELFRLTDRKQTPLMLSPTHEEEITTLVASTMKSYKDLPLRLYQTTRKFRDEMRPRHGLLRSREFIMKDLYTFDTSSALAIETYQEVAKAYRAFFADLKLPILVAEASSGDMGGNYSHEYHLAHPIGEDTIITCNSCGYTASDEVATAKVPTKSQVEAFQQDIPLDNIRVWHGLTKDGTTLINAWYAINSNSDVESQIDVHALKEVVPELDTSIHDPLQSWKDGLSATSGHVKQAHIINVVDMRVLTVFDAVKDKLPLVPSGYDAKTISQSFVTSSLVGKNVNILRVTEGDSCPRCENGSLHLQRALELGHTFYLGTRYSDPLGLSITLPKSKNPVPVEMGCYGIGVSRIGGAVAEHKADERGLNWPRAIAPYEVVVIPTSGVTAETLQFFDQLTSRSASSLGFDAVLDDRKETFGWKMQDADLIGYPVTIILGKAYRERGICEVQCRSLSSKENVTVEDLPAHLDGLLSQL